MATQISGSLITHQYRDFKGVDFSTRKDEVSLYRSPDALNMWKNYKGNNGVCIETRPDIALVKEFNDTINGLFFYEINGVKHRIVHSGTKLYDDDNLIYSSMANKKSVFFVFGENLYIIDTEHYIVYNGEDIEEVVGYVPTTTISKSPNGAGTIYEDVNLLTPLRKNSFVADGTSTEYFLDAPNIDNVLPKVWIDGEEEHNFITDYESGKITFATAPPEPQTAGQDNVVIEFSRNSNYISTDTRTSEYGEHSLARDKIENCTMIALFDNRVFFTGNPNYPNMMWHCSLYAPNYCSDYDYYTEGLDNSKIKAIIPGNNALWVLKEPNGNNTTIFYHNPVNDENYGKIYSPTHSSITTGCVSTGTNFNDDIVFFSDRGMEGVSSDVTTQQVIAHRSSLIDSKLTSLGNYKNLILEQWGGYLLAIVDNKVFLADSKQKSTVDNSVQYEWFYWEFNNNITSTFVSDGVLYLCFDKKIYSLTNTNTNITSYWTTPADEFKYPQYQKTTNKRGCTVDLVGDEIEIQVRSDNNNFETINRYTNVKGYVVPRIKKKKWKDIQLKFISNKPFGLYSATLESYVGNYVKR